MGGHGHPRTPLATPLLKPAGYGSKMTENRINKAITAGAKITALTTSSMFRTTKLRETLAGVDGRWFLL